ncbi:MAG: RluA family pseudouridine synthase [Lachnospiraceae bacterium]|nr:RluA family pseudouridine synthase [Lachnospiraceae bacterium]
MREFIIDENSAGQRLDRFLGKYMTKAPTSFFYKMMRKKNITLNGKKCEGPERLNPGDVVKLFLADETIDQFREASRAVAVLNAANSVSAEKNNGSPMNGMGQNRGMNITRAGNPRPDQVRLNIVYEDKDILLINKPAGMLSQKAAPSDISLTEYMIHYLLINGKMTEKQLETFRPSVCNRLDRNTSGLVICGKSLPGSQEMSRLLRDRTLRKRYLCLVHGVLKGEQRIEGYLTKDEKTNQVTISKRQTEGSVPIVTVYRNLLDNDQVTLLEVELITGKSHQIRAHLASIGHGIIGDTKYGNETVNKAFRDRYGLRIQLLHAWRINFPKMTAGFERLSCKQFTANVPPIMKRVLTGEGLWLPGIQED